MISLHFHARTSGSAAAIADRARREFGPEWVRSPLNARDGRRLVSGRDWMDVWGAKTPLGLRVDRRARINIRARLYASAAAGTSMCLRGRHSQAPSIQPPQARPTRLLYLGALAARRSSRARNNRRRPPGRPGQTDAGLLQPLDGRINIYDHLSSVLWPFFKKNAGRIAAGTVWPT